MTGFLLLFSQGGRSFAPNDNSCYSVFDTESQKTRIVWENEEAGKKKEIAGQARNNGCIEIAEQGEQ